MSGVAGGGEAEDPAGGGVGEKDPAGFVEGDDGVGGCLHEEAVAFLAFAEGAIGEPAGGDIGVAPDATDDLVADALGLGVELVDRAVAKVNDFVGGGGGVVVEPVDAGLKGLRVEGLVEHERQHAGGPVGFGDGAGDAPEVEEALVEGDDVAGERSDEDSVVSRF